ncbi:hypothetical protein [Moorena sp. SIO3H5]|uniref:hypothetical protein n=1 Tax=Moorena sp. SIO3H5 TaxID=2607834 RepID=UPI0013BD0F92|nr:hypothetical protein [Moorena sp. SIO3H5]NEO72649.1 hypothetical protein [Moorena sp. SIO3H5]
MAKQMNLCQALPTLLELTVASMPIAYCLLPLALTIAYCLLPLALTIPDSRFPVPDSRFPVPSSVLLIRYLPAPVL